MINEYIIKISIITTWYKKSHLIVWEKEKQIKPNINHS